MMRKPYLFILFFISLLIWGCKDDDSNNEPLPDGHYLISSDMMSPYIKKNAVVITEDINIHQLELGDSVVIEEVLCGTEQTSCVTYYVAMKIIHVAPIESPTYNLFRITLSNFQGNYNKYVSLQEIVGKVIEVKNP